MIYNYYNSESSIIQLVLFRILLSIKDTVFALFRSFLFIIWFFTGLDCRCQLYGKTYNFHSLEFWGKILNFRITVSMIKITFEYLHRKYKRFHELGGLRQSKGEVLLNFSPSSSLLNSYYYIT